MEENSKLLLNALNQYVKPITFPVAIKISDKEEVPAKFRRPKDIGRASVLMCQAIGLVRRYGWNFAMLNQDHGCAPSMIMFGIKPKPDYQERGEIVYPMYAATPEIGAITEKLVPQLQVGYLKSFLLAPLEKAPFNPDVVLVYGFPAQIVRLVQGLVFEEGGAIHSSFAGRAGCGTEIIMPYHTGQCQVILPGGGARVFGAVSDEELCFAIPGAKMATVARGVEGVHKRGAARIPTPVFSLMAEPVMPAHYKKLEAYCTGEE